MAKFSGTISTQRAPITAETPTRTYEGGAAWELDPRGELFLLAATNMVGEDTFYEKATDRDNRFRNLVHEVTAADPTWMQGFAAYLRSDLKMRSASVVLACEYVRAGGPQGRAVVNSVCQRADEPAEVIGYWLSKYGRPIPKPIKRGVADAARRLYTQYNALKWDSSRHNVTFGDVIELVRVPPATAEQSLLFKYLLDQKHHNDGKTVGLETLVEDAEWLNAPEGERRGLLTAGALPRSWSWERVAGWIPGGMDAQAWEAVIPNMGVMALIRNLRNFDTKRISESAIDAVIAKITEREGVEKSRIFPYQVWTSYREAPSDNWKRGLAKTLSLSTANTPDLGPGTLVLIDTSGSMGAAVSGRSTVSRVEVAAVMAMALVHKRRDTDVAIFADGSADVVFPDGSSALADVEGIVGLIGRVGHSTNLHNAIAARFNPNKHKRVVVFTDDQAHDSDVLTRHVPRIYTFDLGGYGRSAQKNGTDGRYIFGGFSDATMTMIAALESVGHTGWPF